MKLRDLPNPYIELMAFDRERLRLLSETNKFILSVKQEQTK